MLLLCLFAHLLIGVLPYCCQLASIVPRLLRYFQSIFKIMYGELDAHHKKIIEKNAGEKSKLMLTAHMSHGIL